MSSIPWLAQLCPLVEWLSCGISFLFVAIIPTLFFNSNLARSGLCWKHIGSSFFLGCRPREPCGIHPCWPFSSDTMFPLLLQTSPTLWWLGLFFIFFSKMNLAVSNYKDSNIIDSSAWVFLPFLFAQFILNISSQSTFPSGRLYETPWLHLPLLCISSWGQAPGLLTSDHHYRTWKWFILTANINMHKRPSVH